MIAKKPLQLALGIALGMLFVWLILRKISLEDIEKAFAGAKVIWITAALAAFAVGYSFRIERWRLMLQRDTPTLKWRNCAGPLLASVAANNVLPLRAGDVVRAFWFNRRLGISYGISITTLFVERLLDLLMLLMLLGIALTFSKMDSLSLIGVGGAALIVGASVILVVLLFPNVFSPLVLMFGGLAARIAPTLGQKLFVEMDRGLTTLQYLAKGNTMIKLVCWSLMAWLAEGCVFWFAALALPSVRVSWAGWLALPVSTLATLLPSTPGYVGTFDYFAVRAMTQSGNTSSAATAFAILVHTLLWVPPTLVGGLYLLLHPVKHQDKLEAAGL